MWGPYRWGVATSLPRTDRLPEGDEKARAVRAMFDTIAPRYDLVNRVMTFRMDVGWRRRAIRELDLPTRSVVVDLACGTGDMCRDLTDAGLRPIGADLSFGMLAAARTTAPLVHADGLVLPFPDGSVDGVTCGFALRNFVGLPPVLAELARILRPGGRISLLDVAEPPNPVMRWGHALYFGKVVPVLGGLLSGGSDDSKAAYRYLPRSVAYLPEPDDLLAMIGAAGFRHAERRLLSGGISQLYTATRAPETTSR